MATRAFGLAGVLSCLAVMALAGQALIPALATDFAIRETAVQIGEGRVVEGQCKPRLGLVDCRTSIRYQVDRGGREFSRDLHYLFTDVNFGGHAATVLADPTRPELGTTDLALDTLWNRALTLAVIAVALLAGLVGSARLLLGGGLWQTARRELDGKVLVPVPVRLSGTQKGAWIIHHKDAGGRVRSGIWPASKAQPLWLGGKTILAVMPAGGGRAVPMDSALSWLDLTEEERRQVLAEALRPEPLLPDGLRPSEALRPAA
ncbi:hypothetical protein M0638_05135 [Roseomonas sp. NAR14]|uniref:DUF3592 domain-containing protein n=1 Tax=Roseomonas acroporae TaxID=2937791 RepID=A0A9X2BWD5_9PROT|nr:hypothetical protein [Roseomonas acroporae]MCK8783765.1 hypothetical protein [Roseomonas acroporae]